MTIYILDPVCVKEAGHNLVALRRYENYLKNNHSVDVVSIANKHLPRKLLNEESGNGIVRFFSHYYNKQIPINSIELDKIDGDDAFIHSEISKAASVDVFRLIEEYKISASDVIFYPSIDYFSIIGLLNYLKKANPQKAPRFIFRWIGVMEYRMLSVGPVLTDLLHEIAGHSKEFDISHTAESDIHADWLSKYLEAKIIVTPTLATNSFQKYPNNQNFTLSFPGSSRRDKGFDRLASIFHALENKKPSFEFRAYVQLLQRNESKYYSGHSQQLTKNSKVILLPTSMSDHQIDSYIASSDIVVLPYDAEVYKFRSSAIMAEAAMIGRYIIASDECGFSSDIVNKNLGTIAHTDDDFAEKILLFAALSREEKSKKSMKNNKSFSKYISSSYKDLFGELS